MYAGRESVCALVMPRVFRWEGLPWSSELRAVLGVRIVCVFEAVEGM